MKINFIYKKMSHHSNHSGYHQIINYIKSQKIQVTSNIFSKMVKIFPFNYFVKNSGSEWYTKENFYLEVCLALKWLNRKKEIYHFLYGEDQYRYLGNIKKISCKNKIICTFHQPPEIFEQKVKHKKHILNLDSIITVSNSQIPFFEQFLSKDRIFFVPHGVDTTFFSPAVQLKKKENFTCLFVGNWLRDFEILRKVICNLKEIKFIIITFKSNFYYFNDLKNVEFYSDCDENELLDFYRQADILLLPLKNCTANNVILEGMSCGLPIIVTDIGGIRDYVDENCASFVPVGNADIITEQLIKLAQKTDLRESMKKYSRQKALNFDWQIIADKLKKVYQQI